MPVRQLPSGEWQWGTSGKKYKTKAEAQAQARAIYAAGYRGDTKTLGRARANVQKALKASPRAETRYVADLTRLVRGIHEGTMKALDPILKNWDPKVRTDAPHDANSRTVAGVVDRVISGLRVHVAKHVGESFDRMSDEVDKKNRSGMRVLGIQPKDIGVEHIVKTAREANIQLVENAGREYAQQVREVFEDESNFGLRPEELQSQLMGRLKDAIGERADVLESRMALIARDQCLKLNSAITKDRHQKAGIKAYTWSTSQDDRVRPMHEDLEGTQHDWDDPPVTNPQGESNHPGEDISCRCVAIPVLEGEDTE